MVQILGLVNGCIDMFTAFEKHAIPNGHFRHAAGRTLRTNFNLRSVRRWLSWELLRAILRPIYRIYERSLLRQVHEHPVPRHIGLILDGNRRFGRQKNMTDPHDVYMAGAEKLDELLEWCADLKIPAITLWVLSTNNLRREAKGVTGILSAVEEETRAPCERQPDPSRMRPCSSRRSPRTIATVNACSRSEGRSRHERLQRHAADDRRRLWRT